MSKVTLPEVEEIVGLDCKHYIHGPGLEEGDNVKCPTCANTEKLIKMALEEREGILLQLLREWRDAQESPELYDARMVRTVAILDEN